MWNDGWTHEMMGGSYGGWHWLFSFHGFLSIVFVAVIAVAAVFMIARTVRNSSIGRYVSNTKLGMVENPKP